MTDTSSGNVLYGMTFEYDQHACMVHGGKLVKLSAQESATLPASYELVAVIGDTEHIVRLRVPSSTFAPSSDRLGDEETSREEMDHVVATLAYELLQKRMEIDAMRGEIESMKQRIGCLPTDTQNVENGDLACSPSSTSSSATPTYCCSPSESPRTCDRNVLDEVLSSFGTVAVASETEDCSHLGPSIAESDIGNKNEESVVLSSSDLSADEDTICSTGISTCDDRLSSSSDGCSTTSNLPPSLNIQSPHSSSTRIETPDNETSNITESVSSEPFLSTTAPPGKPSSVEFECMTKEEFEAWYGDRVDVDWNQFVYNVSGTASFEGRVGALTYLQRECYVDWKEEVDAVNIIVKNASSFGSIPILRYLRSVGVNVASVGIIINSWGQHATGSVALTYAIKFGQLEVVKWLKDEASMDVLPLFSLMPSLALATFYGYLSIVKYLHAIGGDLKLTFGVHNETLAHGAANGPSFVQTDEIHAASRHQAAKCDDEAPERSASEMRALPLQPVRVRNHLEVLEWLYEKGVDIKAKAKDGYMTTHAAAGAGSVEMLVWLRSKGMDLRKRSFTGASVAFYASLHSRIQVLEWLETVLGWNFAEDRADDGSTLAHAAAGVSPRTALGTNCYDDLDSILAVLKFLHSRGVSMKAKRARVASSSTVLSLVPVSLPLLQWLHSVGVDVKSVCHSTASRSCTTPDKAPTILHEAAKTDQVDVLEWLHSLGVNMYKTASDSKTTSDLISLPATAAGAGALKALKWLHSNGVDVVGISDSNKIPLFNHSDSFVNLRLPAKHHLPPPFLAAANGHLSVVSWYVDELGVKLNALDKKTSASFIAVAVGFEQIEILEWLWSRNVDMSRFQILPLQRPFVQRTVPTCVLAAMNQTSSSSGWLDYYGFNNASQAQNLLAELISAMGPRWAENWVLNGSQHLQIITSVDGAEMEDFLLPQASQKQRGKHIGTKFKN